MHLSKRLLSVSRMGIQLNSMIRKTKDIFSFVNLEEVLSCLQDGYL